MTVSKHKIPFHIVGVGVGAWVLSVLRACGYVLRVLLESKPVVYS